VSIHPLKIAILLFSMPIVSHGAIAFDAAASQAVTSASPITWTHTTTGSNRVLFIGVDLQIPLGGSISGATYNGTAMTLIISTTGSNGVSNSSFIDSIFYLIAPATGANTVSVTFTGSGASGVGGSISLTGVDQSIPLDSFGCAIFSSGTPSNTITTVADSSWGLDSVSSFSGTFSGAGANQTIRWNNALNSGSSIGPISPSGATTFTWSGLSVGWADCAASFCPVGCTVAASTLKDSMDMLLMRGTD
jgi:hypothetical protein